MVAGKTIRVIESDTRLAAYRKVREMVAGRMYAHAAGGGREKQKEAEDILCLIDAMIAEEEGPNGR